MTDKLPYITQDLPGIGGWIKNQPNHFIVEEIPLYDPAGQGDHVYVRLVREDWTTRSLMEALGKIFALREVDLGCAGLKDRQARVTQTISLLLPQMDEEAVAGRIAENLPVQVLEVRRHTNKLKTGHLLGNRFTVVIEGVGREILSRAGEIAAVLNSRGLPNFYGPQRFGLKGDNAARGRELILGKGPRRPWLKRFLLSAFQAELFNDWLAERIRRGWFERLMTGDIAKKISTGGLFQVEDLQVEQPRFENKEITYTGPIYGGRMRWAGGEPGALERLILDNSGVTEENLARARLDGSRRPARLFVEGLRLDLIDTGLALSFSLPKGSYATTLLREFMKVETSLPEE